MSGPVFYAAWALAAGIGVPILAALNATLGAHWQHPVAASVVLMAVGALAAGVALLFAGVPSLPAERLAPQYYLGGLFLAFYVLSITWVAPRFGVGNAIFFVLLGQMISATLIDHFGLFGATQTPINWNRVGGLLLMVAGILLIRRG